MTLSAAGVGRGGLSVGALAPDLFERSTDFGQLESVLLLAVPVLRHVFGADLPVFDETVQRRTGDAQLINNDLRGDQRFLLAHIPSLSQSGCATVLGSCTMRQLDSSTKGQRMDRKVCHDCGQGHPATAEFFSMTRGRPNSYCKPCAAKRAKAHYQKNHERGVRVRADYRAEHRSEWTDYFRRYAAEHSEHRKLIYRAWRSENAEIVKAKARSRYRANPSPYVERARKWAALNPEKASAHTLKKNHRRRGAEPDTAAREYVQIIRHDPCSYCGTRPTRVEVDHIVPVSAGGTGAWDNLTPACRPCNAAKGSRTLLSFLLERIAS